MKVGILTFHYAYNYGAVLQAYALSTYIKSIGCEPNVIDYRCDAIKREYPHNIYSLIPKKWILQPSRWKYLKSQVKRVVASKDQWANRTREFEEFISDYLCKSSDTWTEELKNYDALVFGSDQIWEKNLTGGRYDSIYIGNFQTNAIKISYAASCYQTDHIGNELVNSLETFNALSVREENLARLLSEELHTNVVCVCDPVFLLEKEYYESIGINNTHDYVLIYSVVNNETLNRIAELMRSKGHKVIEIASYKMSRHDEKIIDYSPLRFIGLIRDADYVITNSFHGTAFSIILNKQFSSIGGGMRIKNLLRLSGLEWREIENELQLMEQFEKKIDYCHKDSLRKYIDQSKDFLNNSLNSVC